MFDSIKINFLGVLVNVRERFVLVGVEFVD